MTLLEILLIILLVAILLYLIYYFLRGSTGKISLSRPVESRVDEYLDRKFEQMIEEWSLVRRTRLSRFTDEQNQVLNRDEARIAEMKQFESEMKVSLEELEERLDVLEKSLAAKESSRL